MPARNIICISVDGLRASALGCYANTWHPTPAFDALAIRSHVVEWMICERAALDGFIDAVWADGDKALAQRLSNAGVLCSLITDDGQVAERGDSIGFSEVRHIEFAASGSAATVADTQLAQLFAVAIDQLAGWAAAEDSPARRLLWLHARGYRGAWDAPMSYRESLLDEEDPPAPAFVSPPSLVQIKDHDELLLYRAAYAAQTMVLDACVEALSQALAEFGLDDDSLVILAGARGFALGEHGAVGTDAHSLYSELLHIPCLVRVPGAIGPATRLSQLAKPADIYATVLHALEVEGAEPAPSRGFSLLASQSGTPRQFIIAAGPDGERVIRTPAWMLRSSAAPSEDAQIAPATAHVELYLKPDDRWEANEIASRMPDVTTRLRSILAQANVDDSGAFADSITLDDDLIAHPR